MRGLIKKIAGFTAERLGLRVDNSMFDKNAEDIQRINLRFLRQLAFISGLFVLVVFVLDFTHPGIIGNANMYFMFFMLSAILFALSYIVFNHLLPYSTLLLYFFIIVLSAFCGVIGIADTPNGTAVVFTIVLALLPLQIIDKQSHVIPFTLAVWLVFCICTWVIKDRAYAAADILNASAALIFGILTNRYIFRARLSAINNSRILARSTQIDSITGLPNYKKLDDDLSGKNDSTIAQSLCSLAIFDIDMFKEYNLKYGREAGDKCLKKIGSCLQRISEPGELIIYRYSGTGFAAVSLVHDYVGIERVTKGILALIRGLGIEFHGTDSGIVTLSAGYTDVVECECDEYHKLIEMAVSAMERAKERGGNCGVGWLEE